MGDREGGALNGVVVEKEVAFVNDDDDDDDDVKVIGKSVRISMKEAEIVEEVEEEEEEEGVVFFEKEEGGGSDDVLELENSLASFGDKGSKNDLSMIGDIYACLEIEDEKTARRVESCLDEIIAWIESSHNVQRDKIVRARHHRYIQGPSFFLRGSLFKRTSSYEDDPQDDAKANRRKMNRQSRSDISHSSRTSHGDSSITATTTTTTTTTRDGRSTMMVSDYTFPLHVEVTPQFERALWELGDILLEIQQKEPPTAPWASVSMRNLNECPSSQTVDSVIQALASIPSFLKTILLISDADVRHAIFAYPIIRRVIFSKNSILHNGGHTTKHQRQQPHHRSVKSSLLNASFASSVFQNYTQHQHPVSSSVISTQSTEVVSHSRSVSSSSCSKSASWLVNMMKTRHALLSTRAVDFLEIMSNLTIQDYYSLNPSSHSTLNNSNSQTAREMLKHLTYPSYQLNTFNTSRESLFFAVEHLQDIVPAMLSLTETEMERAAITHVMKRVLDNIISRPFGLTIVFLDLVFNLFLIFGWRFVVMQEKKLSVTNDALWMDLLVQLAFLSILYFAYRMIGAAISMWTISWSVFRLYLFDSFAIIELISIIAVTLAMLMVQVGFPWPQHQSHEFFVVCSLTTCLLWFKFLSYLRIVNRQLATFILAILQILRDVRVFLFIMFIVIVAFGDMIHLVLVVDKETCPPSHHAQHDDDVNGNSPEDTNPFCRTRGSSYLTIYRTMIGDMSLEDYNSSTFTVVLFVLLTFFGIIILLNVLIAIVDESYEKATMNSDRLFGRARVATVANFVALEPLLLPNYHPSSKTNIFNRKTRTRHSAARLLVLSSSFILVILSSVVLLEFGFQIQRSSSGMMMNSNAVRTICILVLVLLFLALFLLSSYLLTGWSHNHPQSHMMNSHDSDDGNVNSDASSSSSSSSVIATVLNWKWIREMRRCFLFLRSAILFPMGYMTRCLLGTTKPNAQFPKSPGHNANNNANNAWRGRTSHIDNTIHHEVQNTERRLTQTIKEMESHLYHTEHDFVRDVTTLQTQLLDMKHRLERRDLEWKKQMIDLEERLGQRHARDMKLLEENLIRSLASLSSCEK